MKNLLLISLLFVINITYCQLSGNAIHITSSSTILNNNEWSYIAITKGANNEGNLYKNGQLIYSGPWQNLNYSWSEIELGSVFFTSYSQFFSGNIDEVRYSNTVRTSSEILNHYTNNLPFVNDINTIGLWHLDEADTSSIIGSSGQNGIGYNTSSSTGKFGNSVLFNGINSRIQINQSLPTSNITIEFWIKPNTVSPSWPVSLYGINTSGFGISLNSCTPPPDPTGSLTQTFCATPAPTLASLTATGTGIQWYAAAIGGTALATTTALVNATTYYASQTVSGCESTTRLAVTVTLNDPQITASATTVCSGTQVNLTANTTATVAQNCNLPANLQTGLVGYWPFCGNANDVSGNTNNGTVNGATLTTDRFGNANSAYSFDGVDDFIQISNSTSLNPTNITVSAWVRINNFFNGNASFVLGKGWDQSPGHYDLMIFTPNQKSRFVIGMNIFNESNSVVQLNNWVFLTATLSGLTSKFYINGVLENTVVFSSNNNLGVNTEDLFFGKMSTPPSYPYWLNGLIDDVSIYNRALSQSEIAQLYTAAPTYLWSTGETTATINPTPAATTTYWCDVTVNGITCRKSVTVTVNPIINPAFTQVAAICNGANLAALPIRSINGITGTWSPALNNTTTTPYTFTPTAGQCATTATMTITVNPNIAPTFTQVATICAGATLAALPTTSNNGITGTWLPTINNTATTTYTFTPTAGLCATTATMTITVNPLPLPPTATITQTFCANIYPTLQNIVVTPSNIKWYSSLTSATPLPITTALPVGATTYYATQYNPVTGCESNGRLAVVATVLLENTPSTLTDQTFCISDLKTLSDIKTDGLNIVWYTSSTGGTPLSNNYVLTVNQTLYAAIFNAATGCESPIRQMVQITIINCQLVPNNLLTLNENSLNDNLNIENIENFPINQIEIYNRFGEIVWKTEYYNNGSNTFLGKANVSGVYQKDTNLPTGTYYFILKYYDPYHKKYTDLKSFLYINNNN